MFIKYIIGLATALLLISNLLAQPCYRGISTNPDAPVNPECPTLINTFDWRTEMLPVTQSEPNLPDPVPPQGLIRSPFWENENHRELVFDFEMYDRPTNSLIADTFVATKIE